MPLTFAHPAAILPFSRQSKYIHFSALVLGSMAPDFEYFFRGRPIGAIGHSVTGFFILNLPLIILIYTLYRAFIHQHLVNHLPLFLQDTTIQKTSKSKLFNVIVFGYSALFGMLTHVIWDSFTHRNGYMVSQLAILSEIMPLFSLQIPVYKYLQHGSTFIGLMLIISYVYFRTNNQPKETLQTIHTTQKFCFWMQILGLAFLYFCFWYIMNEISLSSYGTWVIRIIDSFFCSLLTICLFKTYRQKLTTSRIKGLP
ncbi:DUF4184 family protein [Lysinibacillus sp. FSL K6-0057]|uniref:DUF4184 family protein n=1 Tax=unclassified Lysinibacillus TaxID=2636778 RepID=UPI0031589BD3